MGELKQVDWELWLHGEGIPDFDLTAHVDKTLLEESRQAANRWLVEAPQDLQIMSLKAQQVMLILDHLTNECIGRFLRGQESTQVSAAVIGTCMYLFRAPRGEAPWKRERAVVLSVEKVICRSLDVS